MRIRTATLGALLATSLAFGTFAGTNALIGPASADDEPGDPNVVEATELNPLGLGESLVLVIGGTYSTQAEAETAAAASSIGELQGYYAAPTTGFTLTAAYASLRPKLGEIPCNITGILDALLNLPEVLDATEEQLSETCEQLAASGLSSIVYNLDTQLQRVPFVVDILGKKNLITPITCLLGSRCLGDARTILGTTGALPTAKWMTVSAFRTRAGAEDFVNVMRDTTAGEPAMIIQGVRNTGALDLGLGQEANPDGSGAAVAPLPDQEQLQQ